MNMEKIKYILMILLLAIVFGCSNNGTPKIRPNDIGLFMYNQIDTVLPSDSLDKFCSTETIPSKMDKWSSVPYCDIDGKKIIKYLYIKKMDSLQIIYTIMGNDANDSIHFVKRVTKK